MTTIASPPRILRTSVLPSCSCSFATPKNHQLSLSICKGLTRFMKLLLSSAVTSSLLRQFALGERRRELATSRAHTLTFIILKNCNSIIIIQFIIQIKRFNKFVARHDRYYRREQMQKMRLNYGQVNVIAITAMIGYFASLNSYGINKEGRKLFHCMFNYSLPWKTLLCHNLYFALKALPR